MHHKGWIVGGWSHSWLGFQKKGYQDFFTPVSTNNNYTRQIQVKKLIVQTNIIHVVVMIFLMCTLVCV
jgi:hypothetical protein